MMLGIISANSNKTALAVMFTLYDFKNLFFINRCLAKIKVVENSRIVGCLPVDKYVSKFCHHGAYSLSTGFASGFSTGVLASDPAVGVAPCGDCNGFCLSLTEPLDPPSPQPSPGRRGSVDVQFLNAEKPFVLRHCSARTAF